MAALMAAGPAVPAPGRNDLKARRGILRVGRPSFSIGGQSSEAAEIGRFESVDHQSGTADRAEGPDRCRREVENPGDSAVVGDGKAGEQVIGDVCLKLDQPESRRERFLGVYARLAVEGCSDSAPEVVSEQRDDNGDGKPHQRELVPVAKPRGSRRGVRLRIRRDNRGPGLGRP
ncbi:hypothetical protein [Kribbella sp. DT2]|uniref:hypothetical protein n=1 Tax=Kribbella sp. DT2 TaxID=3393427 RepID=UPI003CF5C95F